MHVVAVGCPRNRNRVQLKDWYEAFGSAFESVKFIANASGWWLLNQAHRLHTSQHNNILIPDCFFLLQVLFIVWVDILDANSN